LNIFRGVVGVLFALFAISTVFSFIFGIVFDAEVWLRRARRAGHWLWLVALFWFNVEIWGRVVYTLLHWT
jgi:hypothetical protein